MSVEPRIYEFIKDLKEKHLRLGKEKIKVLLDQACQGKNLKTIASSRIGKILKRNNWFFYLGKRTKSTSGLTRKEFLFYDIQRPHQSLHIRNP